jgi:very-short-patch-repair endonuclease
MSKAFTTETFIQKAIEVYGYKYDYTLVDYKNNLTKVKIVCGIHGVIEIRPAIFLYQSKGCPKCSMNRYTTEQWIEIASDRHNNIYNYSVVEYVKATMKVKIICSKHGMFEQTPNNHLKGQGCPRCLSSLGENKIIKWLNDNDLSFNHQQKFYGCKNKRSLSFDFYLPEHNICIEFDGEQHYKPHKRSKDKVKNEKSFEMTKLNDLIKNEYCITNGIELIRIRYNQMKDIETILANNFISQK